MCPPAHEKIVKIIDDLQISFALLVCHLLHNWQELILLNSLTTLKDFFPRTTYIRVHFRIERERVKNVDDLQIKVE